MQMVKRHIVLGSPSRRVVNPISEHPVQVFNDPANLEALANANWYDLQIFQVVAGANSFREAGRRLGVSVNTARAGIDRLEAALSTRLLMRSHEGVRVSAEGAYVLEVALEMQSAGQRLQAGLGNNLVTKDAELRICCSEGIGEFWLTPRLASLQDRLPKHNVALYNDFNQSEIHSRRYDLHIGFSRPANPDSIVRRIATLHFMMYVSDAYCARFGEPKSVDDAREHRFVVHEAPGLPTGLPALFVGADAVHELRVAKVNTSYALFQAVRSGIGIGALPTYVRSQSSEVRPLALPIQLKFDMWLSFDAGLKSSIPVRTAIDWLTECFDARRYPWFADRFIHPDAFDAALCEACG